MNADDVRFALRMAAIPIIGFVATVLLLVLVRGCS